MGGVTEQLHGSSCWLGLNHDRFRINCSEAEQRVLGQWNTRRIGTGTLSLQLKADILPQNTWPPCPGISTSFRKGITPLSAEGGCCCEHWYEHIPGPYGRHPIQSGVNSAKASQEVRKGWVFFLKIYGTHITTSQSTLDVHSKACLL